jgi:MFS transporter, AAHS family, 4-hydroxybenzoate transporter
MQPNLEKNWSGTMSTERPQYTGVLSVQGFIDSRPMARAQWLMLGLCFLVLIADGFNTASMAFVAPALIVDLSISKLALGPVLSSALIGLVCGSLLSGPLADRIGRKRVLVSSVLLFCFGSLLSVSSTGLATLWAFRFITGLGIGAAMPNCTTLVSEFVPAKQRSFLLNLMFCGFPLGASAGGFLAAWLIPHYGWRSVFMVGGIAPLFLAAALTGLPESISFMVVRDWPVQKIRAAFKKIAGHDREAIERIDAAQSFKVTESAMLDAKLGWRLMLSRPYLAGTLMLWITYFMGLLLYYLLTGWMPVLVRDAGYSLSNANIVTALFPLGGGIGALCCGWLMDRTNSTLVVSGAYLLTAGLLMVLARSTGAIGPLMCVTFLAGLAMNGAQSSMPVLAAESYPTQGRASGVAWMLGIGRFGGIAGSLAGGELMRAGFSMAGIISDLSFVSLIAAAALLGKDFARRVSQRAVA